MLIVTFLRWLFFSCVPLFLISTGFLRSKKGVTKKYYLSLLPVYISYVIAAVIGILSKNMISDGITNGVFFDILSVLNFKNGYSWYMEMFFGLALIIPFVNISYNNIEKKSHKLILISVLLFLTGVCALDLGFSYNGVTYRVFSDYWVILYPFTYYLIGAYINEYKPKINKVYGTLILVFVLIIEVLYTYLRCNGEIFKWSLLGGEGGFSVAVCAILIFLLLYDIDIKNKFFKKAVTFISSKTLDIYMISYVFDLVLYRTLLKTTPDFFARIKYAPLIITAVFSGSLIYSIIKGYAFRFAGFLCNKIKSEEKNEDKANV